MSGSAVIMARIVDVDGNLLLPSTVESLNYSVVGHERWPLTVCDVVFDSLETDAAWTVDREGYNFRHELDFGRADEEAKFGGRKEVCYELTPVGCPMTLMRFQIGVAQA